MIPELVWLPTDAMTYSAKCAMPVSRTRLPDGTMTVISCYGDQTWDFYPYIPQDNLEPSAKRLSWHLTLPDGRLLTDRHHRALLESVKDLVWTNFVSPPEGRPRKMALTLIKNARHLAPLVRWMVTQNMTRFADIGDRALDYVPFARQSARTGGETTASTVAQRLFLVEDLFHQRHKLRDGLKAHPWPLETACALAGFRQAAADTGPKTEFIPDAVADPLVRAALDYVRVRSTSILDCIEAANAAAAKKVGLSKNSESDARTFVAREYGYKGFREVYSDLIRLRTACYIVIDMFSGVRDSEMVSLEEGCVRRGLSKDGSTELAWMHGTIYKTGARPKRWLIPDAVVNALDVLTRLTGPLRARMRADLDKLAKRMHNATGEEKARLLRRFNLVKRQQRKLFLSMPKGSRFGGPAALTGMTVNNDLKAFCMEMNILRSDGKPYQLHSHQFRRTYARSVARAELGDLMYLKDHFGHWSLDMTLYYADGGADDFEADTELLEMVAEEKSARHTEIVDSLLRSDRPLANGAHWLADWRRSVRTAKNKEQLIADYSGTIMLNGTGHSWCIGNSRGNGCGGLCVLQAQMCVDCAYGVIGPEHRPVWEGIREQQMEALALNDMGPGGQARAKEILTKAEGVLRRLDGENSA